MGSVPTEVPGLVFVTHTESKPVDSSSYNIEVKYGGSAVLGTKYYITMYVLYSTPNLNPADGMSMPEGLAKKIKDELIRTGHYGEHAEHTFTYDK
jgi:hypothetical protein